MGFQKGHKFGKGRPKGSKNKRRSIEDVCAELRLDPFREMARIGSDVADPNRFLALKEMAQYLEPKRKAVEVTGSLDIAIQQELEGLMRLSEEELLELIKREVKP